MKPALLLLAILLLGALAYAMGFSPAWGLAALGFAPRLGLVWQRRPDPKDAQERSDDDVAAREAAVETAKVEAEAVAARKKGTLAYVNEKFGK